MVFSEFLILANSNTYKKCPLEQEPFLWVRLKVHYIVFFPRFAKPFVSTLGDQNGPLISFIDPKFLALGIIWHSEKEKMYVGTCNQM